MRWTRWRGMSRCSQSSPNAAAWRLSPFGTATAITPPGLSRRAACQTPRRARAGARGNARGSPRPIRRRPRSAGETSRTSAGRSGAPVRSPRGRGGAAHRAACRRRRRCRAPVPAERCCRSVRPAAAGAFRIASPANENRSPPWPVPVAVGASSPAAVGHGLVVARRSGRSGSSRSWIEPTSSDASHQAQRVGAPARVIAPAFNRSAACRTGRRVHRASPPRAGSPRFDRLGPGVTLAAVTPEHHVVEPLLDPDRDESP